MKNLPCKKVTFKAAGFIEWEQTVLAPGWGTRSVKFLVREGVGSAYLKQSRVSKTKAVRQRAQRRESTMLWKGWVEPGPSCWKYSHTEIMISNHSSNCGEKYVPETVCVMW